MSPRHCSTAASVLITASLLLGCSSLRSDGTTSSSSSPGCTDLRQASCSQATLAGAIAAFARFGESCGPAAGCNSPPAVVIPKDLDKLSAAERAGVARSIVLLFQLGVVSRKDVDAMQAAVDKSPR